MVRGTPLAVFLIKKKAILAGYWCFLLEKHSGKMLKYFEGKTGQIAKTRLLMTLGTL